MAAHSPIAIARFWSKAAVGDNTVCWPWRGTIGHNGYGHFKWDGVSQNASRIAWEIVNGEPLGPRFACHTCDNKLCVNPHHIYAGDRLSNARDAVERGQAKGNGLDQRGAANPNARLTETQAVEIKRLIGVGLSNQQIAARFPVSHAMVSRIRTGRSWAHLGSPNQEAHRILPDAPQEQLIDQ